MPDKHSTHHYLVRGWRPKQLRDTQGNVVNAFALNWVEGDSHVLVSPEEGHRIAVSFAVYPDHPEAIRVRSRNWAAEYEPNGVFSRADCRAFYKSLVDAGFVVEK